MLKDGGEYFITDVVLLLSKFVGGSNIQVGIYRRMRFHIKPQVTHLKADIW